MKFVCYYRVKPGDNKTKEGKIESANLDDARTLALKAIKAKYPDGVLLNVVDAAQAIEPVDLDRVHAFYYKRHKSDPFSDTGRVVADSKAEATEKATEAVKKAYPDGSIRWLCLAKRSPFPVKNAHSEECPPSLVY